MAYVTLAILVSPRVPSLPLWPLAFSIPTVGPPTVATVLWLLQQLPCYVQSSLPVLRLQGYLWEVQAHSSPSNWLFSILGTWGPSSGGLGQCWRQEAGGAQLVLQEIMEALEGLGLPYWSSIHSWSTASFPKPF